MINRFSKEGGREHCFIFNVYDICRQDKVQLENKLKNLHKELEVQESK